jgi:hypothetical protein
LNFKSLTSVARRNGTNKCISEYSATECYDTTLHNVELHHIFIRMLKIKEDEIGGECSSQGKDKKFVQYFGVET